jgi:hypothetical protein
MGGNVTSLLGSLGRDSTAQLKSKCYMFGALLKPERAIDQISIRSVGDAQAEDTLNCFVWFVDLRVSAVQDQCHPFRCSSQPCGSGVMKALTDCGERSGISSMSLSSQPKLVFRPFHAMIMTASVT